MNQQSFKFKSFIKFNMIDLNLGYPSKIYSLNLTIKLPYSYFKIIRILTLNSIHYKIHTTTATTYSYSYKLIIILYN
jgi:hypothetical protein